MMTDRLWKPTETDREVTAKTFNRGAFDILVAGGVQFATLQSRSIIDLQIGEEEEEDKDNKLVLEFSDWLSAKLLSEANPAVQIGLMPEQWFVANTGESFKKQTEAIEWSCFELHNQLFGGIENLHFDLTMGTLSQNLQVLNRLQKAFGRLPIGPGKEIERIRTSTILDNKRQTHAAIAINHNGTFTVNELEDTPQKGTGAFMFIVPLH